MDKMIVVSLEGHAGQFRLREDAYDLLARYLDRAAARLQDDADRAEVIGDLERSVGDKLAALPGSSDRLVSAADIDAILEEIGAVDTGRDPVPDEAGAPRRRRRLHRIREGQEFAGVCTGLAAYAELRVDWVRWLVVLATIFTAGIFGLVYLALVFILPVDATRAIHEMERS